MSEIPWDSPSRYGSAGLAARRALRRGLRPLTVRVDAEQSTLRAELTRLAAAQAGAAANLQVLTDRLTRLEQDAERAASDLAATDAVLDELLLTQLPRDTRICRVSTPGCRRAICSMATGDQYRALLARSTLSFERYARRWGWDLILSTEERLLQGRPGQWGRVPLIRSLFDDYDWVLWLDTDIVIVDLGVDIAEEVRPERDLYLVEHRHAGGQCTANSGVMLMRSNDWSRAFLDAAWALDHYIDRDWRENGAIMDLLGYSLAPARLVRPTRWLARTRFIDLRFNSVESDRAEQPVFVHRGRPFSDPVTRARQVTADLQCVLRGADPMTAGFDRPARRIETIADVRRREELPSALDAMGLTAVGAEIGVRKGQYSELLLGHWSGAKLISVDPWQTFPPEEYVDGSNVIQDVHDAYHAESCRRLGKFGGRSVVWRMTGREAAARLAPGELDFAYLDARHDRDSVAEDLATWWPLVRSGGVLAGHDYRDAELPTVVFGVRSAVDEFFGGLGLTVHATVDDEPWPSWMVVKP